MPTYQMTDEEIVNKAFRLIAKANKAGRLSARETDILQSLAGRLNRSIQNAENAQNWALEQIKERDRLIDLIRERWHAGWRGPYENSPESILTPNGHVGVWLSDGDQVIVEIEN